jgi:hypothetical protein
MGAARQRKLTSRRRFLHHGATLAGAAVLPAGGAGAIAPDAALRLAQAGTGTAASAITVKSTRVAGSADGITLP